MNLPKRRSQRLKGYDYSQGAYFVTLCTQNNLQLFGKIANSTMVLNGAGQMVSAKFAELTDVYTGIIVNKYIVMPNHLHAVLTLQQDRKDIEYSQTYPLSVYIKRFKTLTTTLYIKGVKEGKYPPFQKRVWQRSFYDHIIRNEVEYKDIWQYIDSNPTKWELDRYYSKK